MLYISPFRLLSQFSNFEFSWCRSPLKQTFTFWKCWLNDTCQNRLNEVKQVTNMLPQYILDRFAHIPHTTNIENVYYGVSNKILNKVCFTDDTFTINPQYPLSVCSLLSTFSLPTSSKWTICPSSPLKLKPLFISTTSLAESTQTRRWGPNFVPFPISPRHLGFMASVSWDKGLRFITWTKPRPRRSRLCCTVHQLHERHSSSREVGYGHYDRGGGIRGSWPLSMMSNKWQQHYECKKRLCIHYLPFLTHPEWYRCYFWNNDRRSGPWRECMLSWTVRNVLQAIGLIPLVPTHVYVHKISSFHCPILSGR